jgi:hypothetical protein
LRAWPACAVLALALTGAGESTRAAEDALPAMLHLADGSVVPLQDWKLSYEFTVAPKSDSSQPGPPQRRDARELWLGKRAVPLAGTTLEVQYVEELRKEDTGDAQRIRTPKLRSVSLKGMDGKVRSLRLEPPHPDLLAPGTPGFVLARAVDFTGQSITGTRRSFCLWGYSTSVECLADPAQQVVKIEFPQ